MPNSWEGFLLILAVRYFLLAGIAWFVWYKLLRKKLAYKKIQLRFPKFTDYQREIFYSGITIVIFTGTTVAILLTPLGSHTLYYTKISEYGWVYFWLAFPIMFFIHDTYFYWTHRMMHHPKLFKYFHLVHHKSINPSPFAAFSFHPLEALVENGIFFLLIIIMPVSDIHLFVFFLVLTIYIIYGHLGWEIFSRDFTKTWVGRSLNTSVTHNQHHQYVKCNFGLYFIWWDKWMGTLRKDYYEQYDEVTSRKKNSANLVVQSFDSDNEDQSPKRLSSII